MTVLDILLLQGGYNSAVVALGAALLGAGGGVVGVFALLRRRALLSDAVSHATLPGVGLGFLVGLVVLGEGRVLPLLLACAAASAVAGVVAVEWIRHNTRLTEDTAIAAVLSTFYGLGIVLLTVIQTLPTAGQAGLEGFLLGSTAGMLRREAELIGIAALFVALVVALCLKEFASVSFDREFARTQGFDVARIDLAMTALMVAVVVIGLSTVGLVLIIAVVILPPVAARFWTDRVGSMVAIAALVGAAGCYAGAAISASAPRMPAGAVMVLTLASLFAVSLIVAPRRGLLSYALRFVRFRAAVGERQGLLALAGGRPVDEPRVRRRLQRRGYLTGAGAATAEGLAAARAAARDQALWERYLEDYPAEAFGRPEWALVPIETVLPSDLVMELERRVRRGEAP